MNLVAERRKIGVYYTTRTRNGKKHSYKNNIRMTFTEEPDGTEIYITPTEDGFKLSRTETEGSVMRQVHTIKAINSSKYADQTYLNFRGICEEEINFDIYKEGQDYYLKKSSVAASRSRRSKYTVRMEGKQSFHIGAGGVRIPTKDINEMQEGLIDPVLVVEEHYKPYLCIKICYKNRSDVDNVPYKPFTKMKTLDTKYFQNSSIRKINSLYTFSPSRFFMNQIGEYAKKDSLVGYRKDKSMIYEPDNMVCAICGKPIQSSIEKYEDWTICNPCDSYVKVISKRAAVNNNNLSTVKDELQKCYDMLKQIMEEM